MKFLSPDVAFYLCKATLRTWFCCYVWADYSSCYLDIWDKLQKWICRNIGPSLAATLITSAHCWNTLRLNLFDRYYVGICLSEPAVPFPSSRGRSCRYPNRMHDFSVDIPRSWMIMSIVYLLTQSDFENL